MIRTEIVSYSDSADIIFEGTVCYDDENPIPKPGVLVAHTVRGKTNFEIEKATELARLGYVGFAVDMYGEGQHSENLELARSWMNELNNDRRLLLRRILLALETLKKLPQVDKSRTGAIGFCFGGKCVLDLVRANAEVKGVVSFHGIYDKPPFENDSEIKSSILVLHGWDDPLNLPSQTVELAEELTARKADWQILSFGLTGHAFTNPKANSPEQGLFYQENSSRRAWAAMERFFAEIF